MKTKQHAQLKRGLKLEVGKYYKTRDGRKAHITSKDNDVNYPFNGEIDGGYVYESWAEDGSYTRALPNFLDLVSEWKEPKPRSEVQGTFLNGWQLRTGKLQVSIHTGKKDADAAKKVGAKRVGQVRHSRRNGLEVVS